MTHHFEFSFSSLPHPLVVEVRYHLLVTYFFVELQLKVVLKVNLVSVSSLLPHHPHALAF